VSLIERKSGLTFISNSRPQPAGGHREMGTKVALPPESYWDASNY